MYENVEIFCFLCLKYGVRYVIRFDIIVLINICWELLRRLLYGLLFCLLVDGFYLMFFVIVIE